MTLGKQFSRGFTGIDQSSIQRNCQIAAGARVVVNWLKVAPLPNSTASATDMGDCNMEPKTRISDIVLNAH
ncbi:hypothetical protein CQ12_25355 [Bradyrhizobium jicamae]|uniref:Uncharacterized protein n=1 Tax=Bradyrhizobium jicamae TaxID=280332 RepID=A0A0R3LJH4_9BRAD|nr:hypothetical protein CQ12_25355 [Bradyrhizobium jicamae]